MDKAYKSERQIPKAESLLHRSYQYRKYKVRSFSQQITLNRANNLYLFLKTNQFPENDILKEISQETLVSSNLKQRLLIEVKENLRKFHNIKTRFFDKLIDGQYAEKTNDFKKLRRSYDLYLLLRVITGVDKDNVIRRTTSFRTSLKSSLKMEMNNIKLKIFLKSYKCKICAVEIPFWQFKAHDENCYHLNNEKDKVVKINEEIMLCIEEIKEEASNFNYQKILKNTQQSLLNEYQKMKSDSLKSSLNKTFWGSSSSNKKSINSQPNTNHNYLYANKTMFEGQNNSKSRFYKFKQSDNEIMKDYNGSDWKNPDSEHNQKYRPSLDLDKEPRKNSFFGMINNLTTISKNKERKKSVFNNNKGGLFDEVESQSNDSDSSGSGSKYSSEASGFVGDKFNFSESDTVKTSRKNSKHQTSILKDNDTESKDLSINNLSMSRDRADSFDISINKKKKHSRERSLDNTSRSGKGKHTKIKVNQTSMDKLSKTPSRTDFDEKHPKNLKTINQSLFSLSKRTSIAKNKKLSPINKKDKKTSVKPKKNSNLINITLPIHISPINQKPKRKSTLGSLNKKNPLENKSKNLILPLKTNNKKTPYKPKKKTKAQFQDKLNFKYTTSVVRNKSNANSVKTNNSKKNSRNMTPQKIRQPKKSFIYRNKTPVKSKDIVVKKYTYNKSKTPTKKPIKKANTLTGKKKITPQVKRKIKSKTPNKKKKIGVDSKGKKLSPLRIAVFDSEREKSKLELKIKKFDEDFTNILEKLEKLIKLKYDRNKHYLFNFYDKGGQNKIVEMTSEYNSSNSSEQNKSSNTSNNGSGALLGDRFNFSDDDDKQSNSKSSNSHNKHGAMSSELIKIKTGFLTNRELESVGDSKHNKPNIIDKLNSPNTNSRGSFKDHKNEVRHNTQSQAALQLKKNLKNKKLNEGLDIHGMKYNVETDQFDLQESQNDSNFNDQKKEIKIINSPISGTNSVHVRQTMQPIKRDKVWKIMQASKTEYGGHKTNQISETDEQVYFHLFHKDVLKYREHLQAHPYVQNMFYDNDFLSRFENYEVKFIKSFKRLKLFKKLKKLVQERVTILKVMQKFKRKNDDLTNQLRERKLLREAISRSVVNFSALNNSLSNIEEDHLDIEIQEEIDPLPKPAPKMSVKDIYKHMNMFNTTMYQKIDAKNKKTKEKKLKRNNSDSEFITIKEREKNYMEKTKMVDIKDFDILKELGKGAFGKVYLVKRKSTNEVFAMKTITLNGKMNEKSLNSLLNEIKVLNIIDEKCLVKAFYSFIYKSSLVIIMEYMIGGDMRGILDEWVCLEPIEAQYYTAQLVLAVKALHDRKIIHRDLKPENILLDKRGLLKLADFGLSEIHKKLVKENDDSSESDNEKHHDESSPEEQKKNDDSGESDNKKHHDESSPKEQKKNNDPGNMVGTPDYIAPEVLYAPPEFKRIAQDYHEAIDWWAVGCLIYEFLTSTSPFGGMTLDEVFSNIKNRTIEWPDIGYGQDMMFPEAKDIIDKFLDPNPLTRLGTNGFDEIKNHPFFKGIDWDKIGEQESPLDMNIEPVEHKSTMKNSLKVSRLMTSKAISRAKIASKINEFKMTRVDLLHDFNVQLYKNLKQKYCALSFQKQLSSKELFIQMHK